MRNRIKEIIYVLKILFMLISCSSNPIDSNMKKSIYRVFKNFNGEYLVYVNKKTFSLHVYNREVETVASYKIGYGLEADRRPKLYVGDNRTPEGEYKIIEILSMDARKDDDAYKKLEKMNRVYFRAKDGHYKFGKADVDLGRNAYGPRFFRIDYPNKNDWSRYKEAIKNGEIPVENGKLRAIGYGIAIHGNNDRASIGHLSSSGCIRMYNKDIVELSRFVQLGTPVIIVAE